MRAAMLPVLTALLLLSSLPVEARGPAPDPGPSRSIYDVEYDDLYVGPSDVLSFVNMSVLVGGTLDIRGTLELINSTMTFSWEEVVTHNVQGILKLGDADRKGTGSVLQAVDHEGSATVNMPSGTLLCANSTLMNISLTQGDISITGSILSNCTLYRPELISHLSGNEFRSGPDREAIHLSSANWEISDNSFTDHGWAVISEGGSLKVSSLRIMNCTTPFENIGAEGTGELRLEDMNVEGGNVSVSRWENMVVTGSSFKGGIMELRGKPGYIHSSSFTDHLGVQGLRNGLVNGCTFMNCTVGLKTPIRSTVMRNRFLSSRTAVQDDRDCEIYHNTFLGNDRAVEGFVQSLWYNSTLKEGNHYDNYKGLDNGVNGRHRDDGIGDTDLPFLGRDYHPLLKDDYWLFPQIPKLSVFYEEGGPEVSLSWGHNNNLRYIVQCSELSDFSKVAAIYSASSSPLEVNAPGNGTYHYRIASWNDLGYRGWSEPTSVHVDQVPIAPVLLFAEPVPEGREIVLTWEWKGEDIFGGTIFYSQDEDDEMILPVPYPSTTVVISGLENGRTYSFSMTSTDNRGQASKMSRKLQAMPMDTVPPPPPSSVTATPLNNSAIAIGWDPPSDRYTDLTGFLLYRKGPGDSDLELIRSFNRGVLYYEDRGLNDNTTYLYNLRSVDDDGPVSGPSQTVQATTLHYNEPPVYIWNTEVIYLVEDGPVTVLDVNKMFNDPDGDRTFVSVVDSFPFVSEVKEGSLYLYQEKDQSGNGYVQLLVTDGEAFETFLIGIYIEPREDSPRDLTIISPVNGSVLLPGSLTLLEGYAFDPDVIYEGDILTFRWSSDRDGELSGPGLSVSRMRVQLSAGPHRIVLTVTDSTGNAASVLVDVMVSLWGWEDAPWQLELDDSTEPLTTAGGVVRLFIVNDGPLFLTFDCTVTLRWGGSNLTVVRSIISPPMDRGLMVLNVPRGVPDGFMTIEVAATAHTLNGTFAGVKDAVYSKQVLEVKDPVRDHLAFMILAGAGILVLVLFASYLVILLLGRRKKMGKRPYGVEDVGAGAPK